VKISENCTALGRPIQFIFTHYVAGGETPALHARSALDIVATTVILQYQYYIDLFTMAARVWPVYRRPLYFAAVLSFFRTPS